MGQSQILEALERLEKKTLQRSVLAEQSLGGSGRNIDAEVVRLRQKRLLKFNVACAIHCTCGKSGDSIRRAPAEMDDRIALVGGVFLAPVQKFEQIRESGGQLANLGDGGSANLERQAADGDRLRCVMDRRENVFGRQYIELGGDI
ncbi:hypothetical protein ACCT18_01380 [Rhizobium ruizarguesonis]